MSRHFVGAAIVVAASGQMLVAQVPPGWAAYSHTNDPAQGMPGGVSLFDPVAGTVTALTGNPLPAELLGAAPATTSGAECVLVRDSDGVIFAGCLNRTTGATTHVYRIDLNGTAVTNVTAYPVGTSGGASYIEQMQWLPDGRILFAHRGLQGIGQGVGTLDPVSGTVSLRASGVGFVFERALALSPDGSTAYIGTSYNNAQVYRLPVAGTGLASLLCNVPANGSYQCQVDHRGRVYLATYASGVYEIDPVAVPVTAQLVTAVGQPTAMGIDRVTGQLLVGTIGPSMGFSWLDPVTQTLTPIPGTYPTNSPTGVAFRHTLAPYGTAAPGSNAHTWQWQANAGGAPTAGNLGFSVTMLSTPGTNVGILAISGGAVAPYNIPSPSVVNVLVDAAQLGAWVLVLPSTPATTPIPIPPGLPAMDVFLQTFHLDNGAWLGTEGLRVSVR